MMKITIKQTLKVAVIILFLTDLALAAPIFTPGSQPTGWISRPVVTYFDVSSGSEAFYQLDYRKDVWSGNVLAMDINNLAEVQTTGPWDAVDPTLVTAASLLDAADYNTGRKIGTNGSPFRWLNMTPDEKTALGSENVLNFVRGDRSNEEPNGEAYHQRGHVLGDILHSTIHYWDDGTNQTLFVGANDGMLHAFNANTGAENWAYVPSMVIPNLPNLVKKNYVHTYFVDGPVNIASFTISGSRKSILVGGLGAGGAGLFALDVTTATAADETAVGNKVLWEITPTGSFANLGHTYSTPVFARLANGTAAVIVGNGYVNEGNGHAVLYVINAVTGALISAIDTGSGSTASPNGLSSPTLYDSDDDGDPDYAYAGDIDGNLWKFDLNSNTSSLVMTTSPVQAITTAPAVRGHPMGGQMVTFATGRLLTSGDQTDTSVHYVYGIWDGAPGSNTGVVTQTLTASTSSGASVRTVTNNALDWTTGNDKGWKVALMPGERVIGEKPFYSGGRFYFLVSNPTTEDGENWLHELVFSTGGSPDAPIFDLNGDEKVDSGDLADNGGIPVAKYMGPGVYSQPRLVRASGFATTLYAYHPDLPVTSGIPSEPDDPGVSGGHFDYDIYYYGDAEAETIEVPTEDSEVGIICKKTKDISKELDSVAKKACVENDDIPDGYVYLTDFTTGAICKDNNKPDKIEYYQTVTCNTVVEVTVTSGDYKKVKHVHEYDDKYDVTGVNMLNPSLSDFDLANAIRDETTEFKILVMNQYLNPAVKLSVGGEDYENVKTYGNLASETDARNLIAFLPTYTRANIGTFIFNLPLDAFKSKDWWGDGGAIRAGLMPTQTGCVNKVNKDGSMKNDGDDGMLGPNGERFDGSLTLQLIKPDTPYDHLELNGPDVSYGWRVKQAYFTQYVLAEYTAFWHHPNKHCYGEDDWIADPPEDFESDAKSEEKEPGSADPTDGVFGAGLAVVSVVTTVVDNVTTTVTTYSDGTEYVKTETVNDDGSITIYQIFRDGTEETVLITSGNGGAAGSMVGPRQPLISGETGRQTWRDLLD